MSKLAGVNHLDAVRALEKPASGLLGRVDTLP